MVSDAVKMASAAVSASEPTVGPVQRSLADLSAGLKSAKLTSAEIFGLQNRLEATEDEGEQAALQAEIDALEVKAARIAEGITNNVLPVVASRLSALTAGLGAASPAIVALAALAPVVEAPAEGSGMT